VGKENGPLSSAYRSSLSQMVDYEDLRKIMEDIMYYIFVLKSRNRKIHKNRVLAGLKDPSRLPKRQRLPLFFLSGLGGFKIDTPATTLVRGKLKM
jgi:hypothetical protein